MAPPLLLTLASRLGLLVLFSVLHASHGTQQPEVNAAETPDLSVSYRNSVVHVLVWRRGLDKSGENVTRHLGTGSGTVISATGIVLTNAHVA